MVWRDLDLSVEAPGVTIADFFELGTHVTERRGSPSSATTGRGVACGLRLGELANGAWTFGIWAVDRFASVVAQAHEFVDRLTPEA